jgi:hypothetical protein
MDDHDVDRELEAEQEMALEQQQRQMDEEEDARAREAAAAGPSTRTRPAVDYREDDDLDSSNPDDSDEEQEDFARRQLGRGVSDDRARFQRQTTDRNEGSVDGGDDGPNTDAASSAYTHRLHQGLSAIPGYMPKIMGHGIDAVPPSFSTGMNGYWAPFTTTGPFPPGVLCRPARVIDMGFVGAWQQASDAERVSDMSAQTDELARARTVSTCALMGLLSVGMAKGFVASPNHSELAEAKKKDPEKFSKERRKLDGRVRTYTYCPKATSADANEATETAMMFAFVHIAMHDPEGRYIGFKILMLIFDKGFSLDALVKKVMDENALIKKSGQINGMPEDQRTAKMLQQNKLQRSQLQDDNLEATSATQYKRITNNVEYLKFLDSVGGQTPGQEGRPYYADISRDTPPGCVVYDFEKCPEDEYGGQHPIGPTVAFNHKRYAKPTDSSPGVNVFTAGTLDARGKPLSLHPCLTDPSDWYDTEGNFSPPQHVLENGWCHICHDPSVSNIMSAQLPHKLHGNIEPEDCLLKKFWKLNKDTNPILKKAQARGSTTFEKNRETVLALFHRMEDLDPEQQKLARAVLETEMLSNDSIDKSVAEDATLERRAYGKTNTEKHGNMWVLSVRQILRDISIEQEKVHAMVAECDRQRRAEIRNADYDAGASQTPYDALGEMRARRVDHAEATTAAIKLGLQRTEHAFSRAKARKSIPPGYYDIAHTGLKAAIKEAGEIAIRRSARNLGRPVDPDDPNALIGTANIGFAHKQSLIATDLTPFGHHRAFLMRLFSSGINIAGRDVKLMLELHMHAFEAFQEVSFFLLLCGGPGSGKSMRAKRLQALLPNGWVEGSGSSSAKAGMNGGFDHLCGRLVYYDGATTPHASRRVAPGHPHPHPHPHPLPPLRAEITNDYASNDSERIE